MWRLPIAVLALVLTGCGAERCRNDIARRIASPDRSHDAVYFRHDCGDGASSGVAIIPHGADLPDLPTTVLTLSEPVDVAITWSSPTQVVLRFPATAKVVGRQDRSQDGVDVRFDTR